MTIVLTVIVGWAGLSVVVAVILARVIDEAERQERQRAAERRAAMRRHPAYRVTCPDTIPAWVVESAR